MSNRFPLWLFVGLVFAVLLNATHFVRGISGEVNDFTHFWQVGQLAALQDEAQVYVRGNFTAGNSMAEAFFYPPQTLLLLKPLALPEPATAKLLHNILTLACYAAALWVCAPFFGLRRWQALVVGLCFGGLSESIFYGQLGGYAAALWLLAFAALNRWPQLAGLPLALLTFKPHLGVILPFWLLLRQRAIFAGAAVLSLLLLLLTVMLWGAAPWQAYGAMLHEVVGRTGASDLLSNQNAPSSLYYGLRRMGLEALPALTVQLVVGLAAFLWLLRQKLAVPVQFVFLPVVTLMLVPHFYPYDLALLILPLLAWLPRLLAEKADWPDYLVWLACFLAPAVTDAFNGLTAFGLWPVLLPLLLWRGVRHMRRA